MTDERETSLQKLQNLDKRFEDISERLQQLKDICFSSQAGVVSYPSRAHWALRWLLQKLQAQSVEGAEFRNYPEACKTLQKCIEHVPSSHVARSSNQFNLIQSVHDALLEAFATGDEARFSTLTEHSGPDYQPDYDNHLSERKRKQHETDSGTAEEPAQKKRRVSADDTRFDDTSTQQRLDLFGSICSVINLLKETNEDSADLAPRTPPSSLSSVARLHPSQASRMLLGGLAGISAMLSKEVSMNTVGFAKLSDYLRLFFGMWEDQQLPEGIAQVKKEDSFAQLAVSVAIQCLQRLAHLEKQEKVPESTSRDIRKSQGLIERFVAKYYVMPIKSRFLSVKQSDQEEIACYPISDEHMQKSPFGALEIALQNRRTLPHQFRTWDNASDCDPAHATTTICSIIMKCSNLESPKTRVAEVWWLRFMLACVVRFLNNDSKLLRGPERVRQHALRSILDSIIAKKLTIADHSLVLQMLAIAGFKREKGVRNDLSYTDWQIVALVIVLSPRDFVLRDEDTPTIRNDQELATGLIRSISDVSHSIGIGSDVVSFHPDPQAYDTVRNEVIPALLEAYVNARAQIAFLSMWHEQLQDAFRYRSKKSRSSLQPSVWEDRDIVLVVAMKVVTTMLTSQKLEAITSLNADEPPAPAMVVLDALLKGLRRDELSHATLDIVQDCLVRGVELLEQQTQKPYEACLVWRTLNTCTPLLITASTSLQNLHGAAASNNDASPMFTRLLHIVDGLWSRLDVSDKNLWSSKPQIYQEALQALLCMTNLLQVLDRRSGPIKDSDTQTIVSRITTKAVGEMNGPWMAEYASNLHPLIYNQSVLRLPPSLEKDIRDALLPFRNPQQSQSLTAQQIERLFLMADRDSRGKVSGKLSMLGAAVGNYLTSIICLENNRDKLNEHIVDKTLAIPHGSVSESTRNRLGLQLVDAITATNNDLDHPHLLKCLSLIRWCVEDRVYTSFSTLMLAKLFDVSAALDEQYSQAGRNMNHDLELWRLFRDIAMTVLDPIPLRYLVLDDFTSHIKKTSDVVVRDTKATPPSGFLHPFSAEICHQLMKRAFAAQKPSQVSSQSIEAELLGLRSRFYQVIAAALSQKEGYSHATAVALTILAAANPQVWQHQDSLQSFSKAIDRTKPPNESQLDMTIPWLAARWQLRHVQGDMLSLEDVGVVLHKNHTVEQLNDLRSITRLALERLSPQQKTQLLDKHFKTGTEPSLSSSTYQLSLLNLIVTADVQWPTEMPTDFLLEQLSRNFINTKSFIQVELSSSSMIKLLNFKSVSPNQYTIESILTALNMFVSLSASPLGSRHPQEIFSRLCQIVNILLSRNTLRKRLRGRVHMLVPVLQGLMRCFFTSSGQASRDTTRQPSSIAPNASSAKSETQHPIKSLKADHAVSFTRLITLLCDPPLQTIRSSSKAQKGEGNSTTDSLIDPLIGARAYSAQQAPLLLVELANCMLQGKFCNPGVREALQPGIWALLEATARYGIGVDALGTVCGNETAREILRSLISEWRRVGGGEKVLTRRAK